MTDMPLVSVIIINYNGKHLLKTCIDSVASQVYRNLEVLVVDNGSGDGSAKFIREHYPEIKLIENKTNSGFAPAANLGIEQSNGEYVAVLNNDTKADPGWIGNMAVAMDEHKRIGSCASKQLNFYDHNIIDSTGIILKRGAYPISRGSGERDSGQYDAHTNVFGAPGASAMYRREMLKETGLFDPDFVSYQEEFDLSFRVRLYGWACVYIPGAIVYHMGGATRARQDERFRVYYMERNRLLAIIKNYPFTELIHYFPYILKYELDVLIRFLTRFDTTPIFARFGALKLLPGMLKKRWAIQRRRVASKCDFRSWVTK